MRITQRSMKFYVTVEFQTSGFSFCECLVSVDSSHMISSSAASWSSFSPPSNFVTRHMLTMCFVVCCSPQSQEGDWTRPHLCRYAWHGPYPVWKWLSRDRVWRGRLKPGCQRVGSVTIEWLTTEVDDQFSFQWVAASTDAMSDHIRCWDASHGCGCSNASACTCQIGLYSIHEGALALWYCYKSTIWFTECSSFFVNLNQCEQFFALC